MRHLVETAPPPFSSLGPRRTHQTSGKQYHATLDYLESERHYGNYLWCPPTKGQPKSLCVTLDSEPFKKRFSEHVVAIVFR
eukprot:569260-Amphidinium_carterae.1